MSLIRLQVEVAGEDPRRAIDQLVALAARMCIIVHASVQGIEVIAGPADDSEALLARYRETVARRGKIAMVSGR